MRRKKTVAGLEGERGLVILLVAVVLLFVVGGMAVLAIDVATIYTARSEAQLAADGGALAGGRVLANSGTTSDPANATLASNAQTLAQAIATQVATQNEVGGRLLKNSEVSFPAAAVGAGSNPQFTVRVSRSDLPTFFARIWGYSVSTVTATATAEAYNPSGANASIGSVVPIAPMCVKPWVLPNLYDAAGDKIFTESTGAINNFGLRGSPITLQATCNCIRPGCAPCSTAGLIASFWHYFPGDPGTSFQPVQAQPACGAGFSDYQLAIAGCVQNPQNPIVCGSNSSVSLYTSDPDADADQSAADAVNCLTHSANGKGDTLLPNPYDNTVPFQFIAGDDNPVVPAATNSTVSSSLVTIPVADVTASWSSPVQIIGFVQVFLSPTGAASNNSGLQAEVINLVGCGTGATGQAIFGNGPSAVAVRLIHP